MKIRAGEGSGSGAAEAVESASDSVNSGAEMDGARPSLLAEPAVPMTGNMVADLMLVCQRTLATREKVAEEQRDCEDRSQAKADEDAVASMRKDARDGFASAVVSGAFQIASAGVQAVGAGIGMSSALSEAKAVSVGDRALERLAVAGGSVAAFWKAGGEAIGGIRTLAVGGMDGMAKADAVDTRLAENAGRTAGRSYDREQEAARAIEDLQAKTLQRVETLLQAESQARLSLIQKM